MKAGRRPIKAQGGGWIIDPLAGIGFDRGKLCRQFRGHDRRLDNAKAPKGTIRQGQAEEPRRTARRLAIFLWSLGDLCLEGGQIEGDQAIFLRDNLAVALVGVAAFN